MVADLRRIRFGLGTGGLLRLGLLWGLWCLPQADALEAPVSAQDAYSIIHPEAQAARFGPPGPTSWIGVPQLVSWSPRVAVFDNFLTEEECEHILSISEPLMEPAMLVSSGQGGIHIRSAKRTSYGAFFDRGEDPVLAAIDQRIAYVTKVPKENVEPWQIMQYMPEGKYTGHVDYYQNEERFFGHSVENFGGQRIATALLYLTTSQGGETVFRKAMRNNTVGLESCARTGVGVESVRGRMVVFQNVRATGEPDRATSHQSCAVTGGKKVVVSRFIREQACPLNKYFSKRKWNGNVGCVDDHLHCARWKGEGACESRDPVTVHRMTGDSVDPGFCEATCGKCRPLEEGVAEMVKTLAAERAQFLHAPAGQ